MHDPVSDILSNKSKFETWAAFNSLSAAGKVSRTNYGVFAQLIRSPLTSPHADIVYCIILSTEDQCFSSMNTQDNSHHSRFKSLRKSSENPCKHWAYGRVAHNVCTFKVTLKVY